MAAGWKEEIQWQLFYEKEKDGGYGWQVEEKGNRDEKEILRNIRMKKLNTMDKKEEMLREMILLREQTRNFG